MHTLLKITIWVGIFIFTTRISAQEQLGLRTERYAGVEGIAINPANNLSYPLTWDFNVGSAGFFFDNSFGYISQTNIINLYGNYENVKEAIDPSKDVQPRGPLVAHLYENNRDKGFSVLTRFSGPSLALHIGNNSFGVFTKARFETNMENFPGSVTYQKIYDTKFGDPIHIPKMNVAGMGWAEIGAHYGHRIELRDGYLDLGANVKYLIGYQGFYVKNADDFNMILSKDTAIISKPDITFGYTNEALNENFRKNPVLNKNGAGFSFDIGVNYVMPDGNGSYNYKIGASLIDLGSIRFSTNGEQHRFSIDSTFTSDFRKYEQYTNPDDLLNAVEKDFYGAINTSKVADGFKIMTPAAISLQADVKIAPLFYLNAMWNQRLVFKTPAVKRDNIIALTPRLEHRWFTATMPIVIYNYNDFRTGLAFRLGYFTVGTDNIGSIFGHGDFTGSDIYAGFKINPFKIGKGKRSHYRGSSTKGVKCYKF